MRAYPRRHGGNRGFINGRWKSTGLSPQARGKLSPSLQQPAGQGPIPAGTGETCCLHTSAGAIRAYPRRHGGNWQFPPVQHLGRGLSPQARGKLAQWRSRCAHHGPIPAGTGETSFSFSILTSCGAYPRRHGGNLRWAKMAGRSRGLSPQARGKPIAVVSVAGSLGPIPAGTGETSSITGTSVIFRAYPRRHGGNELSEVDRINGRGLSPQARGKRT